MKRLYDQRKGFWINEKSIYPANNESTALISSLKLLTFNTFLHSGAYLGMSQ